MPDDAEIIALLREIRDLQRAHFERYQQFTAAALDRSEDAAERQKQIAASSAREREASAEYRAQMQEFLAETRRARTRANMIVVISVLLQSALVFTLLCIVFTLLRR